MLACPTWARLLKVMTPFFLPFSEGAACGQSPEDRARTLAEMKLILQTVGFPWHIVALEEVCGPTVGRTSGSARWDATGVHAHLLGPGCGPLAWAVPQYAQW